MGSIKVKDGDGNDFYYEVLGLGTQLNPYISTQVPFELGVSRGNVVGHKTVNKYGRATDVDVADTDIWDRSNVQEVSTFPTTARVHQITSSSTSDTSAGVGAQTVKVFGLTGWSANEVVETVTMNGTSNVATVNSYVIIHRVLVMSWGSSGPNVGAITATADTDSTVSAQITAGSGQTQMAIYGIPDTQKLYLYDYYCSAIKGSTSLAVEITLMINEYADNQLQGFLTKHTLGLTTEGTNSEKHEFNPPLEITGPAIVKLQGNSSAVNTDVSGGFNGILIDN